ncbi:MAG: SDR family oxidoreductase [Planctomycetaceae bacterium]
MRHVLLTGATGLLGRYLMRDLLTAGVPMAVLVRPSRRHDPHRRVEAAMRAWENILGRKLPRPVVLAGDITQPDFGITPGEAEWVAQNCDRIIHNAASLSFVTTGRNAEPWKTNLDGTRHVLEFCKNAGIRNFFQVSTAYIAGLREGVVYESELDEGQALANCYEESKVESEKLVRACQDLDTLTVFRPGIIIGDSESKITFTFHNFYAAMQLSQTLVSQMSTFNFSGRAPSNDIIFNIDGHERKYLVPVDWVSKAMAEIVIDSKLHGKTYHLTPRIPVTMRLIRDVLEEAIDIYGTGFTGAGSQESKNTELEEIFFEQFKVYESYWRDDATFDSTNTQQALPNLPCPHVDRSMMLALARWAIEKRFAWRDPVVESADLSPEGVGV